MKQLITLALLSASLLAYDSNTTDTSGYNELPWGVGVAIRSTNSPFGTPFATDNGERISSFIQLLYYEGEHFYMDGTEIGYRADIAEGWNLATFTRLRFADFPTDLQNTYQYDGYDPGLRLRYTLERGHFADLELMTDSDSNFYANLDYRYTWYWSDFEVAPYATLGYKSSGYNSMYYGLEGVDEANHPSQKLGSGFDFTAGADVWYHVASNFYLYGKAQVKFLNQEAKKSIYVSESEQIEYWLGIAFRNDKNKPLQRDLKAKPYFRLAYGFATVSNLGEIVVGDVTPDKFNNRMISLFYGHPLSDTFFGIPVSIYFTPGIVWHENSDVQDNSYEIVAAMKAYYTIPLPLRVRMGVGIGVSYITDTTYIEDIDMDPGEVSSKLLQYLDFSVDLNMGDIFGERVEDLWLGYGIHHRSAVFEQSSQYGHFKGGSNYNTVYLQYHY